MKRIIISMGLALLALSSCNEKQSEADIQRVAIEKEGWVYFDRLGEDIPNAVYMTSMESQTASAITAFSNDGENVSSKPFQQVEYFYLVASFQDPDSGRSFSLIFRKARK